MAEFTVKDPAEVGTYTLGFAPAMTVTGEIITAASATVSGPDTSLTVSGSCVITGSDVSVHLAGGTAGSIYALRITITTSAANTIPRSKNIPVDFR